MYVEELNPSKEILKDLLDRYGRGEFEYVTSKVAPLLKDYDQSVLLWNLQGAAYLGLDDFQKAEECFYQTFQIVPDYAEGFSNYGLALLRQYNYKESLEAYTKAIEFKPDFPEAYNNLGHVHRKLNEVAKAITCYQTALSQNPDLIESLLCLMQQLGGICDWSYMPDYLRHAERFEATKQPVEPFSLISKEDNPERQLKLAMKCATSKYKRQKGESFTRPPQRPEKIKIGYFSSDLHDHPVRHLIIGLLEQHDRDRFEIIAFYLGSSKSEDELQRVKQAADTFINVFELSEKEVVAQAREIGLDIALDLNGYSGQSKTGIFAYGVAPVQINYLGYPSTMGADFIDYIVADETLIPETHRKYYSEKVIYLPHCYQPNDDQRVIRQNAKSRADHGLPDDAFVFCCFNNNFKITSREFDLWMRLLGEVDKSVLWLFKANALAQENLLKEAEKRGVERSRIIFADRVPLADHLARQKLADLFLDTFNYNAHTTTSDALWAGLPVITKCGEQFAARVAASLLNAVDLPDLICRTEQEYYDLALKLAQNPDQLKGLRDRLGQTLPTTPLFDTKLYARDFERALDCAYEKFLKGEEADHIHV
ncbi:tetratricopeptide repeat protein [Terasakiella pusilla]|uniref:O-linked N-acetylglucosamine transferase, SPINDLY family protein n=1 Tax=Terasakiella pusilla TaxID=64973 RepID=UPI003AA7C012